MGSARSPRRACLRALRAKLEAKVFFLRYTLPATLAVVSLVFSGCKAPEVRSAGPPPPVPVTVATAGQQAVPIDLRAVGTVEPSVTVQVKSQIAGELLRVGFTEGADINKGDLLFEIDPRPFEDSLHQAQATLARDQALLRQAEANLARDTAQSTYAQTDANRTEQLAKEGVIARSQWDQSKANYDAIRQSLEADQAAIASARATLDSDNAAISMAKTNLSYCRILAPISGRTGNLLVHAGNLVKANDVPLVVINQLTPAFVSFGVPQEYLGAIRSNSSARKLAVRASLQNDETKSETGVLSVIDNAVDTNTGTIKLKATFGNEQHLLWAGQFVNAVLTLNTQQNAVVVPSEAIQAGARGEFIYVVKPDQSVESRDVIPGQIVGRSTVIVKGIQSGETVVTDGQLRLFPGAKIKAVTASESGPSAQ
jgi:multidrug efflux system membrane fusion protein